MAAFCKSWLLASVGLAALALLGLRSDSETRSDVAQRTAGPGCPGHYSTRCTIEIRYAYPAADLAVVEDLYF